MFNKITTKKIRNVKIYKWQILVTKLYHLNFKKIRNDHLLYYSALLCLLFVIFIFLNFFLIDNSLECKTFTDEPAKGDENASIVNYSTNNIDN